MSVFSASMRHRSFTLQISLLCFVLGLLLAATVHTATTISRSGNGYSREGFVYSGGSQAVANAAKFETEIKKRGERITELENKLAKGSDASETLNKELQGVKLLAGLTEAVGPGIVVTLTDSRKPTLAHADELQQSNLIHDNDIQSVVNELRASGAEAISINGQRVIATTAIRCVGPVVQVNAMPTAPPVVIQAVGDPDAMFGGLKTPNGVADSLSRYDPAMIKIEKKSKLLLPAFAGSTQVRFARPPKTARSETSKDN